MADEVIDQKLYGIICVGKRYFKKFSKTGRVLTTDNFLDAARYPTDTDALAYKLQLAVEKIQKAVPRYGVYSSNVDAKVITDMPF